MRRRRKVAGVNLENDLTGAVSRGEIEVFYQPQIEIASGRLVAVESLSRWRHPLRGLIPPRDFISDAESTGAIHALGADVLRRACQAAGRWADGGTPLEIAVNVSAVQLSVPSFFAEVSTILTETPLDPRWLILEVTESLAITDLEVAVSGLGSLKGVGVQVSIDDFGTGFSSIEQVKSLPSTELKIDRSLTQSEAPESNNAMKSIVDLAHELGLRVVAEGIETPLQYDRARHLGCDRAQGFLLGHPVPESEMDALVRSAA